jgi:phosphinothricin acetyltransferase
MGMGFSIRPLLASDWPAVRAIYLEGIATGNATFEIAAPEWERWNPGHLAHCRMVAAGQDGILGFAALSAVCGGHLACCYRRVGRHHLDARRRP